MSFRHYKTPHKFDKFYGVHLQSHKTGAGYRITIDLSFGNHIFVVFWGTI